MYHTVLGPDKANPHAEYAYAWVLPKSNMVGTSIFFRVYASLLKEIEPREEEYGYKISDPHLFGKSDFAVSHASCPGFPLADFKLEIFALWKELTYYTTGWDVVTDSKKRIEAHIAVSDLEFLNKCKIVFGFRNPLDYIVSYHRHQWHSFTDDHVYKTSKKGSSITLEEFTFLEGGLGSWIKQFLTYHNVRTKFPEMFLFVPYEEYINNRYATLSRMINHLGIQFNETVLRKAMEKTSIETIKAFEDRIGGSISRDQSLSSERHVRNGGIGYWQSKMTPEMVHRIELFMNKFDLSLRMFHLANELDSKFSFVAPTDRIPKLIVPAFSQFSEKLSGKDKLETQEEIKTQREAQASISITPEKTQIIPCDTTKFTRDELTMLEPKEKFSAAQL